MGGLQFSFHFIAFFFSRERDCWSFFKLIFNDFFLLFESLANLFWRELFKHLQLSLIKGLERLCFLFELWILFWTKKASSCYKSIITNEFVLNWSSLIWLLLIHSFSQEKGGHFSSLFCWSENCQRERNDSSRHLAFLILVVHSCCCS